MASLQTDTKGMERATLNTTIKKDTLDKFKSYCKLHGYPLNVVLDIFLEQFVNEQFTLTLRNNYMNLYDTNVKHIFNNELNLDIIECVDDLTINICNNTYDINTYINMPNLVKQSKQNTNDNNKRLNLIEIVDNIINEKVNYHLNDIKTHYNSISDDIYTHEHYLYLKRVIRNHYREKINFEMEILEDRL